MRFAVIGCGLIGQKRVRSFKGRHCLAVASDTAPLRAEALASAWPGARAVADWRAAVETPGVDAVIVSTTNDSLAPVTLAAIQLGHHVIVEKPAARGSSELLPVVDLASHSSAARLV